jgi:hypothetical protein
MAGRGYVEARTERSPEEGEPRLILQVRNKRALSLQDISEACVVTSKLLPPRVFAKVRPYAKQRIHTLKQTHTSCYRFLISRVCTNVHGRYNSMRI